LRTFGWKKYLFVSDSLDKLVGDYQDDCRMNYHLCDQLEGEEVFYSTPQIIHKLDKSYPCYSQGVGEGFLFYTWVQTV